MSLIAGECFIFIIELCKTSVLHRHRNKQFLSNERVNDVGEVFVVMLYII